MVVDLFRHIDTSSDYPSLPHGSLALPLLCFEEEIAINPTFTKFTMTLMIGD